MWQTLIGDVRYAARLARRNLATSIIIATTVALGVGATTAVFGIVDAVLIRPLPFAASDRVVTINGVAPRGNYVGNVAYPDLLDFRNGVAAFGDVAAYQLNEETLEHGIDPQMLRSVQIDDAFERIFSLRPAIGRLLDKNDLQVGAAPVVVLSNALWQREFGGDRAIVGSNIQLSGRSVQVVGVLQASDFTFPRPDLDALTPLIPQPGTMMVNRGAMWASAVATLRPGATLDQARRQLTAVAARIAIDYPQSNTGLTARTQPLKEAVIGDVRTMLTLLSLAMVAVLVIACANVANLTIGQAVARTREFAVRTALGGSGNRIARQVLVEAVVVVAIGGAIGVLIAPLLTHLFVVLYPAGLPRANEIHLSYRTLTVAFASRDARESARRVADDPSRDPLARRVAARWNEGITTVIGRRAVDRVAGRDSACPDFRVDAARADLSAPRAHRSWLRSARRGLLPRSRAVCAIWQSRQDRYLLRCAHRVRPLAAGRELRIDGDHGPLRSDRFPRRLHSERSRRPRTAESPSAGQHRDDGLRSRARRAARQRPDVHAAGRFVIGESRDGEPRARRPLLRRQRGRETHQLEWRELGDRRHGRLGGAGNPRRSAGADAVHSRATGAEDGALRTGPLDAQIRPTCSWRSEAACARSTRRSR